jgi:Fic family protein
MPPDPESAVLNHVRSHGSISRREAVELWDLSENQAAYLLRKLVEQGELSMAGRGRGTRYKLGKSRKISE